MAVEKRRPRWNEQVIRYVPLLNEKVMNVEQNWFCSKHRVASLMDFSFIKSPPYKRTKIMIIVENLS